MPTSFLDYIDIPAFQEAVAQTRARQQAGEGRGQLAVQPKPALAPIVERAVSSAQAGQQMAMGENRVKLREGEGELLRTRVDLEAQRLDTQAQQAGFERRMAPLAIGVGALNLGVSGLGGLRTLSATRLAEERAARLEALQRQALEQQQGFHAALLKRYGVLSNLYGGAYTTLPQFGAEGP